MRCKPVNAEGYRAREGAVMGGSPVRSWRVLAEKAVGSRRGITSVTMARFNPNVFSAALLEDSNSTGYHSSRAFSSTGIDSCPSLRVSCVSRPINAEEGQKVPPLSADASRILNRANSFWISAARRLNFVNLVPALGFEHVQACKIRRMEVYREVQTTSGWVSQNELRSSACSRLPGGCCGSLDVANVGSLCR